MVVQTSFSHLINNHPALSYKYMIFSYRCTRRCIRLVPPHRHRKQLLLALRENYLAALETACRAPFYGPSTRPVYGFAGKNTGKV